MSEPLRLRVRFDVEPLRRWVDDAIARNIPYATSRALNGVAFAIRKELIRDLPSTFTIRNTWTKRGMRVNMATKTKLYAEVGSTRPYMKAQAEGGDRPKGPGLVGIPLEARKPKTKKVHLPSKWPRQLLKKRNAKLIPATVRGDQKAAVVLFRRSKTAKWRAWWLLVPRVRLHKRWNLDGTAQQITHKEWKRLAKNAMEDALRPKGSHRPRRPR